MVNNTEIVIYQTDDGQTRINVKLEDETVWLSQEQICSLFEKSKATVSEHISVNYRNNQLFGISEQLPRMVKPMM
jgi:hypothetical protein